MIAYGLLRLVGVSVEIIEQDAEGRPAWIGGFGGAGAGFVVEVGAADGAKALAIGRAHGREGQSQQDGLADDLAQVQDVVLVDEDGGVRFIPLNGQASGHVHRGDEGFLDVDADNLFERLQTARALQGDRGVPGHPHHDMVIGP